MTDLTAKDIRDIKESLSHLGNISDMKKILQMPNNLDKISTELEKNNFLKHIELRAKDNNPTIAYFLDKYEKIYGDIDG